MKFLRYDTVFRWALYDWANSAFTTTVMAGFFPVFFGAYACSGISPETATLKLGISNSASSLLVAFLAPLLGAFAERSLIRRRFLAGSIFAGSLACVGLGFPSQLDCASAALLYAFASTAFSLSIVFYDAMLPGVQRTKENSSLEEVSAFGYALGYLGGGLLFALNILCYRTASWWGGSELLAIRLSFISVGIWWFVFSLPLISMRLGTDSGAGISLLHALKSVAGTVRRIASEPPVWRFLLAYWIYIDGVNSVIKMSVDYGRAIGFGAGHLVTALLITQFVGFPSALVIGRIGSRYGAKAGVLFGIGCYCIALFWASLMRNVAEFYILAVLIGLVQGGVQSLSRAFFAAIAAGPDETELFAFFNLVGKFAAFLGPALMGVVTWYTASQRLGVLSLLSLFVAGGLLLCWVPASRIPTSRP